MKFIALFFFDHVQVVFIIMSRLHALVCLVCILFFILLFIDFITETEPITTEPGFIKPKPKSNPYPWLRFSILKTEDIWLRFRFHPETEPNRPMLSPTRNCDCRAWDLTGIPCEHVVAAIHDKRHQPISYVFDFYSRDTYLKAYNMSLQALKGEEFWETHDTAQMEPPDVPKKLRGRP